MAANFLGFFGKKKEEVAGSQASPKPDAPISPLAGGAPAPSVSAFAPGRKKVTQRLSLKGLQAAASSSGQIPDGSKIQLPGVAAAPQSPASQPVQVEGTVDVPFSVIIKSIPEELLTSDYASLSASPEAVVEIGLPLASVLSMLPSGKIEFSLSELSQAVPAGFIQPLENIPDYANTAITLPLGQVVSRIPPHLLTLRSDQRPIDSNVLSMEDPFSREALEKAQAEAAAKAAQKLEEEAAANQPVPGFGDVLEEPAPLEPVSTVREEEPVPEYDPALMAAAEAALRAEKAAEAGVEMPESQPDTVDSPDVPPETLEEKEQWALPPQGDVSEGGEAPAEEAEPEIDPALVEWAKRQAELEAAESAEPSAGEVPTEPSPSFASSEAFRSFLDEVESDTTSSAEGKPASLEASPAPGAFPVPEGGMFDALNAPTRPIPRPQAPPQPPAIKGFESFAKGAGPAPDRQEDITPVKLEAPAFESFDKESELAAKPEAALPEKETVAPSLDPEHVSLPVEINGLLGLDAALKLTFHDIVNQVRRWPGVKGCVIAGKDGLPISSAVDNELFSKSVAAFAPKIVSKVSEFFVDLGMPEVQEIHVPMKELSTFLFRLGDVYFIVLYKDASMPHWYRQVIQDLLLAIGTKKQ